MKASFCIIFNNIKNCNRNLQLVADKDDNGKFGLEREG